VASATLITKTIAAQIKALDDIQAAPLGFVEEHTAMLPDPVGSGERRQPSRAARSAIS
jgi:hypothetical protein